MRCTTTHHENIVTNSQKLYHTQNIMKLQWTNIQVIDIGNFRITQIKWGNQMAQAWYFN